MKNKEMLYIKQNSECYIDKDCKWRDIGKQTEEMAKDLRDTYNHEGCEAWHCSGCGYEQYGKEWFCQDIQQAEKLTAKGYHKASNVAKEIFEEIETIFNEMIDEATGQLASARLECDLKTARTMEYGIDVIHLVHRTLKKSLEKKYMEGE